MLAPVYSATHLHWFPIELKRAYSNDNCLLPMLLPGCYTAHVCWVFCVLSFFALTLPLEPLYACYVLCSMFLPHYC